MLSHPLPHPQWPPWLQCQHDTQGAFGHHPALGEMVTEAQTYSRLPLSPLGSPRSDLVGEAAHHRCLGVIGGPLLSCLHPALWLLSSTREAPGLLSTLKFHFECRLYHCAQAAAASTLAGEALTIL